MLAIEKVDYEMVKAACIALNEVLEKPFQVVGAAKDVLVSQFTETIEELSTDDKNGLPDEVIEFYNVLFADEAKKDAPPEEDKKDAPPVEAKEEVKEKEEGKKEEGEKEEGGEETPKKKVVGVRSYKDFSGLTKYIEENNTPTGFIDKLTLKKSKLSGIIEGFKAHMAESGVEYRGFKTATALRAHISYREDRGWIYERAGKDEGETIKLVGFKDPKAE